MIELLLELLPIGGGAVAVNLVLIGWAIPTLINEHSTPALFAAAGLAVGGIVIGLQAARMVARAIRDFNEGDAE